MWKIFVFLMIATSYFLIGLTPLKTKPLPNQGIAGWGMKRQISDMLDEQVVYERIYADECFEKQAICVFEVQKPEN